MNSWVALREPPCSIASWVAPVTPKAICQQGRKEEHVLLDGRNLGAQTTRGSTRARLHRRTRTRPPVASKMRFDQTSQGCLALSQSGEMAMGLARMGRKAHVLEHRFAIVEKVTWSKTTSPRIGRAIGYVLVSQSRS